MKRGRDKLLCIIIVDITMSNNKGVPGQSVWRNVICSEGEGCEYEKKRERKEKKNVERNER